MYHVRWILVRAIRFSEESSIVDILGNKGDRCLLSSARMAVRLSYIVWGGRAKFILGGDREKI